MKIVILCGGRGARLREETEFKPKPMVDIGGRPVLWHIMKIYAHYGFKDFVLCLGYKGEMIKEYFLNYEAMNNDFTIQLGNQHQIQFESRHLEDGWSVTLADTGDSAMTGARIKRIERYIDSEDFMVTYGDGVADIKIDELLRFHRKHKKVATLTGVRPLSRFGEILTDGDTVKEFREKPQSSTGYISGGFFVFNRQIFDCISDDDNCVLEKDALEQLALQKRLAIFPHTGFWQCIDTYRDYKYLQELWHNGDTPWMVWK